MRKVTFKDLSPSLKFIVILAWISLAFGIIDFIYRAFLFPFIG